MKRSSSGALGSHAQRHRVADERLAAPIHLVEQLEVALSLDLGQRLAHRFADQGAVPDQGQVGAVGQFEHVVRTAQHGDDAGSLFEQRHQALVLVIAVALGQHFAGHLDAGAEHAGHAAVFVTHRRIREAEPGLFVVAVAPHA
jgi:hypothetical protein